MTQTSRAFPYSSFIPAYANGLGVANDATTPNTKLTVYSGSTLDSTGTFQISLTSNVTIDAATVGLNGIDTGTLTASKVYAIFLVADPVTLQASGCIISLSNSAPVLPFGYSAIGFVGFVTTDASAHFLKGYWTAANAADTRTFMYDAPQATAITAGNATSYTAIDLSTLVPSWQASNIVGSNNAPVPVYINSAFTPGAASRTFSMQPASGTGDAITVTGQVTSVIVTTQSFLMSSTVSNLSKINYKVSNSGDAVAINVAGYQWYM